MIKEKIRNYMKKNQKGDVFVMVAASMAAMMFCGAAVVDLGSLYAYKSELQNAADSAALAGAHAYADNEESIDKHPEADKLAAEYVKNNLGAENNAAATYQAKDISETANAIYYRVKLEDHAPTYFLKYFMDEGPTITVDGIASIATVSEADPPFKDLFIFKNKFDAVNSIINPDKNAIENNLSTVSNTFDGKVVFTDGSGKNENNKNNYKYTDLKYSTQTDNTPFFVTAEGKKKSSIKTIAAEAATVKDSSIGSGTTECKFGSDGQLKDKNSSSYWSRVDFEDIDLMDFGAKVKAMVTDSVKSIKTQYLKTSNEVISTSDQIINIEAEVQNLTIEIDNTLSGSDPLYIYCDPNINGLVKIELKSDMDRPLIVCAPGTGKDWKGDPAAPNVQVNLNGHKFRGVIYAPNSVVEPFNAANSTFEGSIAADSISLRGDNAAYKYVNFAGNSTTGSGSSSSGKVSSSSQINLINSDSISWD